MSTGQVKFLDSWALRTTQCPTLSKGKFQEIIFTGMGYNLAGGRSRGAPQAQHQVFWLVSLLLHSALQPLFAKAANERGVMVQISAGDSFVPPLSC